MKSNSTARLATKLVVRYTHTYARLVLPLPGANSDTGVSSAWITLWLRMKSLSASASGASRTPQMPIHCAMLERGMCTPERA